MSSFIFTLQKTCYVGKQSNIFSSIVFVIWCCKVFNQPTTTVQSIIKINLDQFLKSINNGIYVKCNSIMLLLVDQYTHITTNQAYNVNICLCTLFNCQLVTDKTIFSQHGNIITLHWNIEPSFLIQSTVYSTKLCGSILYYIKQSSPVKYYCISCLLIFVSQFQK